MHVRGWANTKKQTTVFCANKAKKVTYQLEKCKFKQNIFHLVPNPAPSPRKYNHGLPRKYILKSILSWFLLLSEHCVKKMLHWCQDLRQHYSLWFNGFFPMMWTGEYFSAFIKFSFLLSIRENPRPSRRSGVKYRPALTPSECHAEDHQGVELTTRCCNSIAITASFQGYRSSYSVIYAGSWPHAPHLTSVRHLPLNKRKLHKSWNFKTLRLKISLSARLHVLYSISLKDAALLQDSVLQLNEWLNVAIKIKVKVKDPFILPSWWWQMA